MNNTGFTNGGEHGVTTQARGQLDRLVRMRRRLVSHGWRRDPWWNDLDDAAGFKTWSKDGVYATLTEAYDRTLAHPNEKVSRRSESKAGNRKD